MKLLGIHRETLYSPDRENDDATILRLTAEALQAKGFDVEVKRVEEIRQSDLNHPLFAMCEGAQGVALLKQTEDRGHRVVNKAQAVLNCHRWRMWPLLQQRGVPLPSTLILQTPKLNGAILPSKRLWIKRGDVHNTQEGEDVVYVDTDQRVQETLQNMSKRGIEKALVQEHVEGDLIKFYGVIGSDWFKWFYHNGVSRGIPLDNHKLYAITHQAAEAMGLEVYGGDVIVAPDRMVLIDINSWPSFALCRDEASQQIANYLQRRFKS